MMIDGDEAPIRKGAHEIGQDLSMLSVEELRSRIELLRGEIARLETSINLKNATREAANRFFR